MVPLQIWKLNIYDSMLTEGLLIDTVSPSARLMYGEYWFRLSRLSMMVIGSFASYTKTKLVESAVWCLLTLDDVKQVTGTWTGNRQRVLRVQRDRNTWTRFRIRIVLFLFWTTNKQRINENENKTNNRTTNKINERLITNKSTTNNEQQMTNNKWRITGTKYTTE